MGLLLRLLFLTSAFLAITKAQDCIVGVCESNEQCCSESCLGLPGFDGKYCQMNSPGDVCKISEQCTNKNCVNGRCAECGTLNAECNTNSDCCNNGTDDDFACEANLCKYTYKDDCSSDDECLSGQCSNAECTCHAIGKYCDGNDYCCTNICQDQSCQCISTGKNCPTTGPYCCDQSYECKASVENGIPFCGECKSNAEPCSQNEECCQFRCNSNGYCDCVPEHYTCRTDDDCCNFANCLKQDDGSLQCGYMTRPNGFECMLHEQCESRNCEDGTCQCLPNGATCLDANNQCCSGICTLANIAENNFSCY